MLKFSHINRVAIARLTCLYERVLKINGQVCDDVYLQVKMAALRFLSSEMFTANECVLHFIIAAADPKHR